MLYDLIGIDYITVLNFVVFACVHHCFPLIDSFSLKTFPTSFDLLTFLRALSSRCKFIQLNSYQEAVKELGVLFGFNNPPFPGFDPAAETGLLAAGGGLRCPNFQRAFDAVLDGFRGFGSVVKTKFFDYVKGGEWATSGSSSEGRLDGVVDGEEVSFRVHKNLLLDAVDGDGLARRSLATDRQQARAIVKAEAGKIRLAVSSDVENYLQQAWVNLSCKVCYLSFPGVTLDESVNEQMDRVNEICDALVDAYCLPFDYKSFDHQLNTSELISMCERFISWSICVDSPSLTILGQNIRASFYKSTITSPDGSSTYQVTGGLPSGLRWTSAFGNVWNSVISLLALGFASQFGFPVGKFYIRGDDSLWVGGYGFLSAVRAGYSFLGAIGNNQKFSILPSCGEFLREWITPAGCRGIINRAITAVTQRKPWTDDPRDNNSILEQVFQALDTITRRGGRSDGVSALKWAAVKNWSHRTGSSVDSAFFDKVSGGLGLLPPQGYKPRSVRSVIFLFHNDDVYVKSKTDYTLAKLQNIAQKFGFPGDVRPAAEHLMSSMVSLGQVRRPVRVVKSTATRQPSISCCFSKLTLPSNWKKPSLPRCVGLLRCLKYDYSEMEKLVGSVHRGRVLSKRGVLRFFPALEREAMKLQKRGLRLDDSISILFGDLVGTIQREHRDILGGYARALAWSVVFNFASKTSFYFYLDSLCSHFYSLLMGQTEFMRMHCV